MKQKLTTLDIKIDDAWKHGLQSWNAPSIPYVITQKTSEEIKQLGEIGDALNGQLAFMKYPEFQTYMNLEKIVAQFPADPQRAAKAISSHEIGHRFCPYDIVTSIILSHAITKALQGQKLPYDAKNAAGNILNLFSDMCINTRLTRSGNEDLAWTYQELSKDRSKKKSKLWHVYGRSMELAWSKEILPKNTRMSDEEKKAAQELARLFQQAYFDKAKWKENSANYAKIISKFLEDEKQDGKGGFDNTPGNNIPKDIDDKIAQELAKRVAQIGSDGLPQNPQSLKEFQEI